MSAAALTLARARERIAALAQAATPTEFVYAKIYAVGWFSALFSEGLIDAATYNLLQADLDAITRPADHDPA